MTIRQLATRSGVLFAVGLVATATLAANGQRWWAHVTFLADDSLEGRNTGSEGHRTAARYIAAEFERAGLKPAGANGYLQPVKFRSRRIVEETSSLALVRDGQVEPVVLGDEATFSMRIEPARAVEAPMVFVGYGLHVPERPYDDLAGLDLKGKVALLLSGGPSDLPGPLLAHYQSAGERWASFKRAGAIGLVTIQNPRGMDIPWERSMLARFLPSMALADRTLDETAGQQLAVTVNPARAEKFFAGSGHTFQELLTLAIEGKRLPRFPVPARVKATVSFETEDVESENVAGVLPGTDPRLAAEHVVLSAHLDHIGAGRPINGDGIYNGAMDNASGVAALLDVAATAKEQGKRFKRSVIFLAVTAEEKGLLGSRYYAAHPTVPPASIVANINMDMFLPIIPFRGVIAQGLEESDMAADLRAVAAPLGLQVWTDPEPERNAFIRSDQYSFIRRGVPALSLKVGYTRDSAEATLVRKWRTERYHAPSDDLQQPIDVTAAAEFDTLLLALTEAVANRAERPRWNDTSFFRRFSTSH